VRRTRKLALELVMSPSEVHACIKRAETSRLLHGPGLQQRPNIAALEEFLVHGLKYVFLLNVAKSLAVLLPHTPPSRCAA